MMELTSTAFDPGGSLPQKYTCDGEKIAPPMGWSGVPDNAQSLVLVLEDPDAPRGTFTHWTLYNIPAEQKQLPEGTTGATLAAGIMQGQNDFGNSEYGAPCPPPGPAHRYIFRLFALDQPLDLRPRATRQQVLDAMQGHILDQAELIKRYARG